MKVEGLTLARRAAVHAALADVARLAVVDELALGDRSPSELQAVVGLPSNLMAHHLKVLQDAGLVSRRRSEGDRRRTYLTLAETGLIEAVPGEAISARRVIFVCSANSARSQLAAALWSIASDIPVGSGGTRPAEQISAGAAAAAGRHSLRLVSSAPQLITDVADDEDYIVAVCDNAYEELGDSVSLHWSIPDPVRIGSDAAFDHAFVELDRRIATLASRLIAS